MDGGPPPTSYRREQITRYEGLTEQYKKANQKMKDMANALPEEQKRDLLGQIEVADVMHEALLKEFGYDPHFR